MTRSFLAALFVYVSIQSAAHATTIRVPQDHASIQAAIDAAGPRDTVLVSPGTYNERLRMKAQVTVRSIGDDTQGATGLKRAEAVIIDGGKDVGDKNGNAPGVTMAPGSILDGVTITNVGRYDQALWQKHFDSQGEELGDDEGSVQAEGTVPAISIQGIHCTVINCIVHHNGDVGIGIMGKENSRTEPLIAGNNVSRNMGGGIGAADGAEPIIRGNRCFENLRAGIGSRNASPIITENECYRNVRAGIGCREGATPVMRGNKCYQNRRAGIGIRMKSTAPIVERNECDENDMAGIGCRDGAQPLLVGNQCLDNEQAGIGMQHAEAVIYRNTCKGNKLVAVGVTDKSNAVIIGNQLTRVGGQPPIVAVKDGSSAYLGDNSIVGGGVAAILVQGTATIRANRFDGAGKGQGNAIWMWEGSTALITDNAFDGYRAAINATKSVISASQNVIKRFENAAIVIRDSKQPAHVFGNTAITTAPQAKALDIQGPAGIVQDNEVKAE